MLYLGMYVWYVRVVSCLVWYNFETFVVHSKVVEAAVQLLFRLLTD